MWKQLNLQGKQMFQASWGCISPRNPELQFPGKTVKVHVCDTTKQETASISEDLLKGHADSEKEKGLVLKEAQSVGGAGKKLIKAKKGSTDCGLI